ncbi:MAG: hypothetical protein K0R00_2018 [Herbinix sp.]|jgi:flagellar hook-associated protein 2|nr:hypothetical protein [Herbinix sp.]
MLQVYNNLIEGLSDSKKMKYPISRKDDVRRVYKDIINLSKNSPFFKISLTKENQEFTIGVKEAALIMKSRIEEMKDPEFSGFERKEVIVSKKGVLDAILMDQDTSKLPSNIDLEVHSLAQAQVNKGKEHIPTTRGLAVGEYDFTVQVGEDTYELKFLQENKTENQDTLKRMAQLINQSVWGLTASVEKGSSNDSIRLEITADRTGRYGARDFSFAESDSYYSGAIYFFGLNRVEQEAAYANFSLNGVEKQSASNEFTLENTIQINLHRTIEEPVALRIVSDSKKILSSVEEILDTHNNLIKLASDRTMNSEEHFKALRLISEMKGLRELHQVELENCGIIANEDGTLEVDKSIAVSVAEDGRMEQLFEQKNGFIAGLLKKAEMVAINPMEYLDKTIVTYPNNEGISLRNPYITSVYSGLFFNSYC